MRHGCECVIVCFGAVDGKLTNLFFNPLLNLSSACEHQKINTNMPYLDVEDANKSPNLIEAVAGLIRALYMQEPFE